MKLGRVLCLESIPWNFGRKTLVPVLRWGFEALCPDGIWKN